MPQDQTLRYRPVNGQDSTPLVAALLRAGYDASPETVQGQQCLFVSAKDGAPVDREKVRAVIAEANTTSVFDGIDLDAPVKFEDER